VTRCRWCRRRCWPRSTSALRVARGPRWASSSSRSRTTETTLFQSSLVGRRALEGDQRRQQKPLFGRRLRCLTEAMKNHRLRRLPAHSRRRQAEQLFVFSARALPGAGAACSSAALLALRLHQSTVNSGAHKSAHQKSPFQDFLQDRFLILTTPTVIRLRGFL
jgi:hypothetical protein